MNRIISRGLWTVLVTGGFLALGAGVAYADDSTDGSDGIGSGTQGVLGINLPIAVGGNAISVLGDSSSSGSSTSGGGSGGSSSSGSTSGTNSLLGGTQAIVDGYVPVTIGGNAISVIGDSSSEDSSFEGASGTGEGGTATTSGKDGILGGTQVVGDVNAPITVSGNAISVAGDSFSGQYGTVSSSDSGGAGGTSGTTSGDDGVLGGTQVVAGPSIPITVGGNAISVIGDGTVDNGGDDDNDVGGDTVTPPGVVTPAGVAGAALLAATGSDLLVPTLTLALLLLAAGVFFMTRSRTARS